MTECHGNGEDHCCYIAGVVCSYLEENTVSGRRWACGLLVKYGTWAAMNPSPEYRPIGTYWETINRPFNYCEAFDPRRCCREADLGRSDSDVMPLVIQGLS